MLDRRVLSLLVVGLLGHSLCVAQEPETPFQEPEVPLSEVEIRLKRFGCYGPCPVYELAIHGNGLVEFDGKRNTAHQGSTTWRMELADLVELVNRLLSAHFFDAASSYVSHEVAVVGPNGGLVLLTREALDNSSATLTFKLGERQHSVYMYHFVPTELRELLDAVDELAKTEEYVRGIGG